MAGDFDPMFFNPGAYPWNNVEWRSIPLQNVIRIDNQTTSDTIRTKEDIILEINKLLEELKQV